MKNIVLCSDGTGNAGGKGYETNVWRLFKSLDLNGHLWDPQLCEQVAYHDDGVGTRDNPIHKLWGQATGWGLTENILQLYLFLWARKSQQQDIPPREVILSSLYQL